MKKRKKKPIPGEPEQHGWCSD